MHEALRISFLFVQEADLALSMPRHDPRVAGVR
jgi:hypothetical protein